MTNDIPRYCPDRPLPPYSYVPGLSPHPISDPRGHRFGRREAAPKPLNESVYATNECYLFALDLFNHGYYWEAHEEWERLWHTAGRTGPTADFLKGLIKLAAAGVKLREGRTGGVKQHAERAVELLHSAAAGETGEKDTLFGLRLTEICRFASALSANVESDVDNNQPDGSRTLGLILRLELK